MDVEKAEEVVKACDELIKELKDEKVIMPYSGYAISQLIKELKEMPILLSDAEMEIAYGVVELPHDMSYTNTKDICRAQLKKVVEYINSESDRAFSFIGEGVHLIQIPESSWQALKEEAGLT